jgi:acyl-CoA reductase-like NAD-dependent aldehyde dehydrogenase
MLATAETIDNGKPIRETMAADIPLAIDHFRYFAGCIRAQEGSDREIDTRPMPTTSMSRWAWSARSFPGTSRS